MSVHENDFFTDRVSNVADTLLVTEPEYIALSREATEAGKRLSDTFTEEQKELYFDREDAEGFLMCYVDRALYRLGFLDGIALGMKAAERSREYE
jgi:hypothetical protein